MTPYLREIRRSMRNWALNWRGVRDPDIARECLRIAVDFRDWSHAEARRNQTPSYKLQAATPEAA